jgi:hypothetical protein
VGRLTLTSVTHRLDDLRADNRSIYTAAEGKFSARVVFWLGAALVGVAGRDLA